jgi:hypothetical protein
MTLSACGSQHSVVSAAPLAPTISMSGSIAMMAS